MTPISLLAFINQRGRNSKNDGHTLFAEMKLTPKLFAEILRHRGEYVFVLQSPSLKRVKVCRMDFVFGGQHGIEGVIDRIANQIDAPLEDCEFIGFIPKEGGEPVIPEGWL